MDLQKTKETWENTKKVIDDYFDAAPQITEKERDLFNSFYRFYAFRMLTPPKIKEKDGVYFIDTMFK